MTLALDVHEDGLLIVPTVSFLLIEHGPSSNTIGATDETEGWTSGSGQPLPTKNDCKLGAR